MRGGCDGSLRVRTGIIIDADRELKGVGINSNINPRMGGLDQLGAICLTRAPSEVSVLSRFGFSKVPALR